VREPDTEILSIPSAERMQALGGAIGGAIEHSGTVTAQPFIIALEGDLGAGKTTLVGGILRAYGITGPVRSPTYTLIEPYETPSRTLYHLDLYRLVDPDEVEPLGIRDLLASPVVLLIEWPSKAAGALPATDLQIEIAYPLGGTEGREVRLIANSSPAQKVLRQIVAEIPELRQLSS
jgi:tRNA threonylcarbamoyladenosine biosynthesis protein TsaE